MVRTVHENDPDAASAGEYEERIDVFRLGRKMQEWSEQDPVGARLVDEARDKLQQAINVWLRSDDPASQEVREAHFRARVATEFLSVIESAIDDGRKAETLLSEQEASGRS